MQRRKKKIFSLTANNFYSPQQT